MKKRLTLLLLIANAFLILNAYAQVCGPDGKPVEIPEGSHCCCPEDTTTPPTNDYKCQAKSSACASNELELTFRDQDTKKKLCPCENIIVK